MAAQMSIESGQNSSNEESTDPVDMEEKPDSSNYLRKFRGSVQFSLYYKFTTDNSKIYIEKLDNQDIRHVTE